MRLYTGNAFDLVGERRQTNFRVDTGRHWAEESFEIKVRNHKKEEVEVRVVEHMVRWIRPRVPASGEAVITYPVHYSW